MMQRRTLASLDVAGPVRGGDNDLVHHDNALLVPPHGEGPPQRVKERLRLGGDAGANAGLELGLVCEGLLDARIDRSGRNRLGLGKEGEHDGIGDGRKNSEVDELGGFDEVEGALGRRGGRGVREDEKGENGVESVDSPCEGAVLGPGCEGDLDREAQQRSQIHLARGKLTFSNSIRILWRRCGPLRCQAFRSSPPPRHDTTARDPQRPQPAPLGAPAPRRQLGQSRLSSATLLVHAMSTGSEWDTGRVRPAGAQGECCAAAVRFDISARDWPFCFARPRRASQPPSSRVYALLLRPTLSRLSPEPTRLATSSRPNDGDTHRQRRQRRLHEHRHASSEQR